MIEELEDLNALLEGTDNEIESGTHTEQMVEIDSEVVENTNIHNEVTTQEVVEQVQQEIAAQETAHVTPSWTIPFSELTENELIIQEGDMQKYIYKKVLDPEGNETGLFEGFCLDSGVGSWKSMNGLLSKKYIAANLNEFINSAFTDIEFTNQISKHEPFYMSKVLYTNNALTVLDADSAKTLFELITGASDLSISNINSKLSIMISNSYNGTMSIRMDYVITNSVNVNGNSVSFDDYFLLNKHHFTFQHMMGGFDNIASDFSNIQNYLDTEINRLKSHVLSDNDIQTISSKFYKKAGRESFLSSCENLNDNTKNMFYVMMLASMVLNSHYDIQSHKNIRSYIDKFNN